MQKHDELFWDQSNAFGEWNRTLVTKPAFEATIPVSLSIGVQKTHSSRSCDQRRVEWRQDPIDDQYGQ